MIGKAAGRDWADWDWRAFARVVTWTLLAMAWARWRGVALLPAAMSVLSCVILLSVISFGILAHIFALVAMGTVRAAMLLDETAYSVSERMVRPLAGAAPFAIRFWMAFAAEIALVLGAAWFWRAVNLGPRLAAAVMEILQ